MNLGTSLYWVSKRMGGKVCLVEDGVGVSYLEVWQNIEILANGFLKLGIKENDRIAILLPNCKEFIYSFYALARINAISIPLNCHFTSYELERIFDDCKPKGVITTPEFYETKILPIINKEETFFINVWKILEHGKLGELPDFNTSNNQVATINYTYRGLGKPLGAMLTHGNYHHGAIGYVRLTQLETSQRALLVTPMSHIFTLVSCVIVPLLRGATVVIMKSFIPKRIFKAIEVYKIDFIIGVPTIYTALLRNYKKGGIDISSLKYGITGGSYLSSESYREIKKEMGIELLQGYGSTETMPITCNPKSRNKPGSLGIPGHEVKVRVVDKDGDNVPSGQKGEILVGGPTVMKGYYNKNGETGKYLRDGWFWTGDYGYKDEEGYVYFSHVEKNIIKVGGNNVDLKEVEEVILSKPEIEKVSLNARPDKLWGSILESEVWTEDSNLTDRDVINYCRDSLANYKVPREVRIVKA